MSSLTPLLDSVSLDDRYTLEQGVAVMSGLQALVRLPMAQRRADRAAGLNTGFLISGYEGSPLGGYDLELSRRRAELDELGIVFRPALNEEAGATAVMGSQQAYRQPGALYQGVAGLWYGKAPGLDRAADAIRHANLMGTHRYGGALACVGDDAMAKSSTVPSASELALMDLGLPVLVPADPHEVLELGLHGLALSRVSGLWAGLKIATPVADGFETVTLRPERGAVVEPDLVIDGHVYRHEVSAHMLGEPLLALERSMVGPRLELARRYGVANQLNEVVADHGDRDRVGLVAAGKAWRDLLEALARLGVDEAGLERRGIRLLKLGMPYPLDRQTVRGFARGLDRVVVVEEKRSFIEMLLRDALYGMARPPQVLGKRDGDDRPLLPANGELTPEMVVAALAPMLLEPDEVAAIVPDPVPVAVGLPVRTPYFCSGCPHSTASKVPAGAQVSAGIGCHGLALVMSDAQVGEVTGICQMGGEGAGWIGMSPFVSTDHLIQNIGDGTFHHSGSLGVRAAVAAGVNITFKLLFNSAVAMTGGQPVVGGRSVPELTRLLAAEGVARTLVTTDDPSDYDDLELAPGVEVWDRARIVEAQQQLARIPGVTVLIHDQQCATELRRQRKRGTAPVPATRAFINERVCEGCGDCGTKSNCLSVHPVETEFGRKTTIHQSSCNQDLSCLQGDCPSFLVVTPGDARPASAPELAIDGLPAPPAGPRPDHFAMRLTGVGGTGVVTVAQVLAMAARLEGRHVAGYDQVGMAQKYGAVVSDLQIGAGPVTGAPRLAAGSCDLYLACDLVAAAQTANLTALDPAGSVAVISTTVAPTADQVVSVTAPSTDVDALARRIEQRTSSGFRLPAQEIALTLLGSDQVANMVLVGAALQLGALPLGLEALDRAIELNGVAVQTNRQAIARGRQAVSDPDGLARALEAARTHAPGAASPTAAQARLIDASGAPAGGELHRLLTIRIPDLVAYQDLAYARRYAETVGRVREAEEAVTGESDGPLARAVAHHLHRLMAYKDEYEVARLHLDPALRAAVTAQFGDGARYSWQLQPPVLRSLGVGKITVGPWFAPVFGGLRRMRRLRGTRLDPFGHARVRQTERELIGEYERTVAQLLAALSLGNHERAVAIAELPDQIRGYEEIKLANVERYRAATGAALTGYEADRRVSLAGRS